MAANIFANANKPVAHQGRNGFDLSSAHAFTMRCGVLRPVIVQDTVPNSSYKINCGDIVRTTGLQTAAFLRGRHELDFFFIPYRQLMHDFDNVVFGRGDMHSPAMSVEHSEVPVTDISYGYMLAADIFCQGYIINLLKNYFKVVGWDRINAAAVIYSYFAGQQQIVDPDNIINWSPELINEMLSVVCYDTPNFSDRDSFLSCHPIGADSIKLLSSLGYGDIYVRIKNLIDCYIGDWQSDEDPLTKLSTMVFFLGEAVYTTIEEFRLNSATENTLVSLFRLNAYQKVWYDVYRDSINDNDRSYTYSWSSDLTSTIAQHLNEYLIYNLMSGSLTNPTSWVYFLRPRLRQYKKDLNTGLYPNAQFGDAASLDFSDVSIYNNFPAEPSAQTVSVRGGNAGINVANALFRSDRPASISWRISGTPSAYDIKYTLALQKYREMLLRAGSRTRDLLKAEFGVESRYINDNYVHTLGSFGGALDINKVNATSDSGAYSVGDMAANVFTSLQGNTIEFTCNDYGIIVGVMSFLPEMFHNATGINPMLHKSTQLDFYHEAFENLGLQPVGDRVFDAFTADRTHGFGARFNEYKQNLDLAHDNFMSSPNWDTISPDLSRHGANSIPIVNSGTNSNYVTVRDIHQDLSLLSDRNYIFPDAMDSLFTHVDDGTAEGSHFDVALQCNMTAVLPMSVLGMM